MGWATGTELANKVWSIVRPYLDPYSRQEIAQEFLEAFENMDCDTMDECAQLQMDLKTDPDDVIDDLEPYDDLYDDLYDNGDWGNWDGNDEPLDRRR